MKLVWLDLNASYAHSSLALPAIHAQAGPEEETITWHRVQATLHSPVGSVTEEIIREKPDVLAATSWLFTHELLLKIVARVKVVLPECLLVLGGPEMLGNNENYLRRHPFINAVFRGEGEVEFHRWLRLCRQPELWGEISGLCWIDNMDTYRDNGCARVNDFAGLQPPEESRFFDWSKPFVQLETTRGCYNTCAFCVSGREKPVRTISLEQVKSRLQQIREKGIKEVRLLDRTFNAQAVRTRKMLSLFREYGEMRFHLEIHPGILSDELIDLLESMPSGMLHIEAGIQSLREEVLKQSQRLGDMQNALNGLEKLSSIPSLVVHADLIAGLPGYAYAELFEDLRLLMEFGPEEIQLELLKVLPGTLMKDCAKEWGLHYAPDPPYEVLQTSAISVAELQRSRTLSRVIDGYYNTAVWQAVIRKLNALHPDFLSAFHTWLAEKSMLDQPLSLEKRGLLLYDFCKSFYPHALDDISVAWIRAGIPFTKEPGGRLISWKSSLPEELTLLDGEYREGLRFYLLRGDCADYYFGFDRAVSPSKPVFVAMFKTV